MPPNVAITIGDQNPYWKYDIKRSQLFLRVSLVNESIEIRNGVARPEEFQRF
jgi:hypothetical protein